MELIQEIDKQKYVKSLTVETKIDGLHISHKTGVRQILSKEDLQKVIQNLDNVILSAQEQKTELENYINNINTLNIKE